jgi:flagellar capping protein FliD
MDSLGARAPRPLKKRAVGAITGTLKLNSTRFSEAVEASGDEVRAMFAGTGGLFTAIEDVLDEYANASGFIRSVKERLTRQIASMDSQIIAMQARLARQRATLQREFTAADEAMTRLKAQSSSLSSIATGFGIF